MGDDASIDRQASLIGLVDRCTMNSDLAVKVVSNIDSLPNELLTRICRDAGDVSPHQATEIDHDSPNNAPFMDQVPFPKDLATLWSLCLVGRRMNGPATQVLYDNVILTVKNMDAFEHTVNTSAFHAGLVKRFFVGPRGSSFTFTARQSQMLDPGNLFWHNYEVLKEHFKDWTEPWTNECVKLLSRGTSGQLMLAVGLRQLFALAALPTLQNLHLNFRGRRVDWRTYSPPRFEDSWLYPGDHCLGFLQAQCIQKSQWTAHLTHLRLETQHGAISLILPVLSLQALKSLYLKGFASYDDANLSELGLANCPDADLESLHSKYLASCFDQDGVAKSGFENVTTRAKLRSLELATCKLSQEDLKVLVSFMPELKHFHWHGFDEICSEFRRIGLKHRCLAFGDIMPALTQVADAIESISIRPISPMDFSIGRCMGQDGITFKNFQGRFCTRFDFSKFGKLETLDVPVSALYGVPDQGRQLVFPTAQLPLKLKSLALQINTIEVPEEQFDFFTEHYRRWGAFVTETIKSLDRLTSVAPGLMEVKLTLHQCYRELLKDHHKDLAKAITDISDFNLIVQCNCQVVGMRTKLEQDNYAFWEGRSGQSRSLLEDTLVEFIDLGVGGRGVVVTVRNMVQLMGYV